MQQIVFLHAIPLREEFGVPKPDAEKVDRARTKLSPALKQVPPGVEVHIEVQTGQPNDLILRAAKNYQCDVILIGTQSRNLLTETLFGSTTAALSQRTSIPLMTVRPQLISALTAEELNLRCQHLFQGLLVPYDDSDASKRTIARLIELAKPDSASTCSLCRVFDEGGRRELSQPEEQRIVSETLEPVQAQLQAAGIKTEIELRHGNPIVQILQVAQDKEISAIALSSNAGRGFATAPSFAAELLRRSLHPVLFFPVAR